MRLYVGYTDAFFTSVYISAQTPFAGRVRALVYALSLAIIGCQLVYAELLLLHMGSYF